MSRNTQGRAPETAGTRPFFKTHLRWLLPALCIAAAAFTWYASQLVVVLQPEGNLPRQCFTVKPGEEWHILFTHSVQKTPVEEYFTVRGAADMVMTHTIYQSLGVGLPYAPGEGSYHQLPDGRFYLEMNRPYRSVALRTAVQAMHKIIHAGTVYDLCQLYGQGTLVEVKALHRYEMW